MISRTLDVVSLCTVNWIPNCLPLCLVAPCTFPHSIVKPVKWWTNIHQSTEYLRAYTNYTIDVLIKTSDHEKTIGAWVSHTPAIASVFLNIHVISTAVTCLWEMIWSCICKASHTYLIWHYNAAWTRQIMYRAYYKCIHANVYLC